jgi:hypothetical protein
MKSPRKVAAEKAYAKARKTKRLGQGDRFAALAKVAGPGVAAMAGRKAHGDKNMAKWAAEGRKRAAKK